MAEVNVIGAAYARALIEEGLVDTEAAWAPGTGEPSALPAVDSPEWPPYAIMRLGFNNVPPERAAEMYRYPFGRDDKVFQSALEAAQKDAGKAGDKEVFDEAASLLRLIHIGD